MSSQANRDYIERAMESAIRIATVAALVVASALILSPFLSVLAWAVILAVASYPAYDLLVEKTGNRRRIAAVICVLVALLFVILPSIMLAESLVDSIQTIRERIETGTLAMPDAPARVRDWPLVGERVYEYWVLAQTNMQAALSNIQPQLEQLGRSILGIVTGAGKALLQFVLSIIIAGVILAHSKTNAHFAKRVFLRLAPERGEGISKLAEQAVRGVAIGVVGVSLIQAALAGIGFVVIDLPGAALWALLVLILGVIQLPSVLVMIPIIIWAFNNMETFPAVVFTVFAVVVSLLDNVLKPIFMGRGVDAPMLVVFLGAIGGFITSGFIGLFTGAIILVLAYDLFIVWLEPKSGLAAENEDEGSAPMQS